MQMAALKYGYSKTVNCSFNEALERAKKALQEQGFESRLKSTSAARFEKKLGLRCRLRSFWGHAIRRWHIRRSKSSRR